MGNKKQKTNKGQAKPKISDDVPHIRFATSTDASIDSTNWNEEQDWENLPRKQRKANEEDGAGRLPIKLPDGRVKTVKTVVVPKTKKAEEEEEEAEEEEEIVEEKEEEKPKLPEKQRVLLAKEELANIAIQLNEDPEEHIGQLKRLREMLDEDPSLIIKKLVLATQAAVYKDLIPGYRIRPLTEEEQKIKVSKDVKKQRQFEQSLVANYQHYVEALTKFARASRHDQSKPAKALSSMAINCVCALLKHVPHFNFRGELLKILVEKLSTRNVDESFMKARECMEEVFRADDDGNISLDAVKLLTKMFKAKDYYIHETVLNTFLSLRLLTELNPHKVTDDGEVRKRKRGEKKAFINKKNKKLEKERKAIAEELKEADAAVSHEQREKNQAETLKLVFIAYFKILKEKPPGLMAATLEGLARYAHLINVDFFGDLLEALKDLIRQSEATENEVDEDSRYHDSTRNSTRESLLCIATAFALLGGQGTESGVSLDLSFFTTHLYKILFPLSVNPDCEFSSKSLRIADPLDPHGPSNPKTKVNVATEIEMSIRAMEEIFFKTRSGQISHNRLAAFVKRLMTTSLHFPERSSLACLGMVTRLSKRHVRKLESLFSTEETVGDGVYNGLTDDPELSNPYASTVWETILLEKHYSPKIAGAAKELPKVFKSDNGKQRN